MHKSLLKARSNTYSQNGEDGIIQEIFRRIGTTNRVCCEFGAWDGIHFSNCRKLILDGWSALMIEGHPDRFQALVSTYRDNAAVRCANRYVDSSANSLTNICRENSISAIDFLSIDIDGLDYEIFESIDLAPRVICIEVNAGHSPSCQQRLDRNIAKNNVGQPLEVFVRIAHEKNYDLVCYTGNAFFVRRDANAGRLTKMSAEEAYAAFLEDLDVPAREWLYLVNRGSAPPFHRYDNAALARTALSIGMAKALLLIVIARVRRLMRPIFRHR